MIRTSSQSNRFKATIRIDLLIDFQSNRFDQLNQVQTTLTNIQNLQGTNDVERIESIVQIINSQFSWLNY